MKVKILQSVAYGAGEGNERRTVMCQPGDVRVIPDEIARGLVSAKIATEVADEKTK
jgi:hypothetical protein